MGAFTNGLLIGIGAAFLFAPKKGSETRTLVLERVRALRGQYPENEEAQQQVQQMASRVQEAQALANRAAQVSSGVQSDLTNVAQSVGTDVSGNTTTAPLTQSKPSTTTSATSTPSTSTRTGTSVTNPATSASTGTSATNPATSSSTSTSARTGTSGSTGGSTSSSTGSSTSNSSTPAKTGTTDTTRTNQSNQTKK